MSPAIAAILISLGGIFALDVMALLVKLLSADYLVVELAVYRNLFGMISSALGLMLTPRWHRSQRPLYIRQWPLAFFRGVLVAVAQLCFYASLLYLELATAATIVLAMPLFSTALSVVLLNSRVGIVRWIAVLIGFSGVIIVMGPTTDTFTWATALPLVAAMLYALISVTIRWFDDAAPTALINIYTATAATLSSIVFCFSVGGFTPFASTQDLITIIVMGMFGGLGVLLIHIGFRMTSPSNLAPFHYFGIPFSFILGWLFLNEAPFERLFPGVLLIVGSGLLVIWRERRLGVSQRLAPRN